MAKDSKLLYNLTALENLDTIFQKGLLSRAALSDEVFEDVADAEILNSRQAHGLEQFVPFHFLLEILLIMACNEPIPIRTLFC